MCEKCRALSNGIRSGKGTGFISKYILPHPCNHAQDCTCNNCKKYKDKVY